MAVATVVTIGSLVGCGASTVTNSAVSVDTSVETTEKKADETPEKKADEVIEKKADETAKQGDVVQDIMEYMDGEMVFYYDPKDFEGFNKEDSVTLSYVNSDVQAAGSNVIIFSKEKNSKVEDIVNTITASRSDLGEASDSVFGSQEIPVKILAATSNVSEGSNLNLVDNLIIMQSGDNVILIEIIRTVGPNDEDEMTIDGAFTATLESFKLIK